MEKHIQILGILMIVLGVLGLLGMLTVISLFGLGGMFSGNEDVALGALGLGVIIGGLILLTHLPALVAGIGILKHQEWARILGIIVAVLNVLSFPFGTALAIYAFWVLLKQETVRIFAAH
ncbi:MAG: hypothetical protein GF341_13550 [candidate division Zixibacteria bacterium]|nr:hypothetical protein [candidate division Zixibacteria bacterium]